MKTSLLVALGTVVPFGFVILGLMTLYLLATGQRHKLRPAYALARMRAPVRPARLPRPSDET
ncbi:MAG: hypothetical protein R3D33_06575 [Hyphomicrobiaceae bacterium]